MNWGTAPYAGLKATQIKEVWRVLSTALVKEKETKNTVRFQEVEGDDPPVIGTLYLQKYALRRIGNPARIVVTITAEGGTK